MEPSPEAAQQSPVEPDAMGQKADPSALVSALSSRLETESAPVLPAAPKPLPAPLLQADPPRDPLQIAPAATPQAGLAEPAPRMKEGPRPERGPILPEGLRAPESLPAVKASNDPEPAPLAQEASPMLARVSSPSSTPLLPQELVSGTSLQDILAPAPGKPVAPMMAVDPLSPSVAPSTQSTAPQGPDGTSLAALSPQPRPLETVPPVAPPLPASPAAPPNAPVAQVEGSVRWMLKSGAQEAQLQLHPESLGQVTIHLKVEGGEVHARLWITEPASVQAIQEGRPHLELSLKGQGLQLGSFDLHQGHRPSQETPSAPAFREPAVPEPAPARQEAPAPPPSSFLNPHRIELYA